jgi:CRP-like cAMP-binding protein
MLRRDHKADLLRDVPLFSGCSKKELGKIAAIADEIDLREGKVLTRQGGPGREFFVLLEGSVDVVRDGERINVLGAGDFFGEMGLISQKPRNATITTTSPVRTLVITETNFRRLLRDDPGISMKVLETVAARTPPSDSD